MNQPEHKPYIAFYADDKEFGLIRHPAVYTSTLMLAGAIVASVAAERLGAPVVTSEKTVIGNEDPVRFVHYNQPITDPSSGEWDAEALQHIPILNENGSIHVESIANDPGDSQAVAQRIFDFVSTQIDEAPDADHFQTLVYDPVHGEIDFSSKIDVTTIVIASEETESLTSHEPGYTIRGNADLTDDPTAQKSTVNEKAFTAAVRENYDDLIENTPLEDVSVDISDSVTTSFHYNTEQYQELTNLAREEGYTSISDLDYAIRINPSLRKKAESILLKPSDPLREPSLIIHAMDSGLDSIPTPELCGITVQPTQQEYFLPIERDVANTPALGAITSAALLLATAAALGPYMKRRRIAGIPAPTKELEAAVAANEATPAEKLQVIAFRHAAETHKEALINDLSLSRRHRTKFVLGSLTVGVLGTISSMLINQSYRAGELESDLIHTDQVEPGQLPDIDNCDPTMQVIEIETDETDGPKKTKIFVPSEDKLPYNLSYEHPQSK